MLWTLLTSALALKLWFFLAVWYEVGIELGLNGTSAFVIAPHDLLAMRLQIIHEPPTETAFLAQELFA